MTLTEGQEDTYISFGMTADLILTLSEAINEGRTAVRILPSVEGVQLRRHSVQLLVRIEKLGQQTLVRFLQETNRPSSH